jgi:trypsin
MRTSSVVGIASGVALLALTGCGGGPSPDASPDPVAEARQAMVGGNLVTDGNSGIVGLLYNDRICSGALLTNSHVITAGHCVPSGFVFTHGAYFVGMGGNFTFATAAIVNTQRDLAILKLEQPLPMRTSNGSLSTTGYSRPLDTRNTQQLDGQYLMCVGYGHATLAGDQQDWGLQKAGIFKHIRSTTNALDPYLMYLHSDNGAAVAPGDSGGPCLNNIPPATSALASVIYATGPLVDKTYGVTTPIFDQTWWMFWSLVVLG